jgi:endogenous inhibitor of DNA gyrase (YacG/DUF329 family)
MMIMADKILTIKAYCPCCGNNLTEVKKNKSFPLGHCNHCKIDFKWQLDLFGISDDHSRRTKI